MTKKLEIGMRVRTKRGVRTFSGWKGTGVICEISDRGVVKMVADSDGKIAMLASYEVVPLPDQAHLA